VAAQDVELVEEPGVGGAEELQGGVEVAVGDGTEGVVQVVVPLPDELEEALEAAGLDVLQLAPRGAQSGLSSKGLARVTCSSIRWRSLVSSMLVPSWKLMV
jgi:hypothetical protein